MKVLRPIRQETITSPINLRYPVTLLRHCGFWLVASDAMTFRAALPQDCLRSLPNRDSKEDTQTYLYRLLVGMNQVRTSLARIFRTTNVNETPYIVEFQVDKKTRTVVKSSSR